MAAVLGRVKCKVGVHRGIWSDPTGTDCTSYRICERCEKVDERTVHDWPDFTYAEPGHCLMTRSCRRCGEGGNQTRHQYGTWRFTAEGSCNQVRTCARCSSQDHSVVPHHTFDQWRYGSPDSCEQRSHCSRCGKRADQAREQHHWSGYEFSARTGGTVRYCTRCGVLDNGSHHSGSTVGGR